MIVVSEQVRQALADRVPVVAMESTISSTLGLPVPHNAEALRRCTAAIEAGGAAAHDGRGGGRDPAPGAGRPGRGGARLDRCG